MLSCYNIFFVRLQFRKGISDTRGLMPSHPADIGTSGLQASHMLAIIRRASLYKRR